MLVLLASLDSVALSDSFSKPWHINLPRKKMLAAWKRLKELGYPIGETVVQRILEMWDLSLQR